MRDKPWSRRRASGFATARPGPRVPSTSRSACRRFHRRQCIETCENVPAAAYFFLLLPFGFGFGFDFGFDLDFDPDFDLVVGADFLPGREKTFDTGMAPPISGS